MSLWIISCSSDHSENPASPDNIIDEAVFAGILTDYAIAESVSNLNLKSVVPERFDTVYAFNPLKERGIRTSQFDSSLRYYSAHPKIYRQIYDTVLSNLNNLRLKRENQKVTKTP